MSLSLVTAPATEPVTIAEVKAHLRLDSSVGEPAPLAATVALISPAAAGNCDNGDWRVLFTFVTADGETDAGELSDIVTVVNKNVNGKIAVTAVPVGGSAVTARNVYAVAPGATQALYVGQIANNYATTYTLNIAASSLGAQAPTTNTTEDPELVAMISSARQHCETFTHRAFITQTWDLKLDRFPCGDLVLPRAPLVSVTSVTYVDTAGVSQTWDSAYYSVDAPSGPECEPGRIFPIYSRLYPSTQSVNNAVTVRFVAGYGAASSVPSPIKSAIKVLIAYWYENRGDAEAPAMPAAVASLLWPYKSFSVPA